VRELEAPLLAVLAELMYLLGELPKAQDALFELIPRSLPRGDPRPVVREIPVARA
jgi:hypothetical protein